MAGAAPHLQRDAVRIAESVEWLDNRFVAAALRASACDILDEGVVCGALVE